MNEYGFHLAVYALGLSWSLLALSRIGPGPCCVLAYPLGLTIWVSISMTLVLSPIPFNRDVLFASVAGVALVGAGLSLRSTSRGHESFPRSIATLLVFSALFAVGAWLATHFNLTVWSNDSHHIVGFGRSIAHHGEITATLGPELSSRAIFQVMVQGMSIFFDELYLSANPTVLALCVTAAFPVLALRGLGGPGRSSIRAVALVALTTAAISTPYFVIVQYFYLHETYAAGAYLLLAATCFWLAEIERNAAWLPFAFAFSLALSLQRVEAPIVAMIFLAMAIGPSQLPRRGLNWGLAIHSSLLLGWLVILFGLSSAGDYHSLRGSAHVLSPRDIGLMAAGVLGATLGIVSLQHPRLAGLRPLTPKLVVGALGMSLMLASLWRPAMLLEGLTSTLGNMASLSWGGVWYAFLLLGVLSTFLRPLPHAAILSLGPIAALALNLLLSSQHHSTIAWSASSNRMLTYLIPTFSFYLLMVYGRALLGTEDVLCPDDAVPDPPPPTAG